MTNDPDGIEGASPKPSVRSGQSILAIGGAPLAALALMCLLVLVFATRCQRLQTGASPTAAQPRG